MAKDPICGMTVEETSVLRAERDGQTFYFCSDHCRQTFLNSSPSTKSFLLTPINPAGKLLAGKSTDPLATLRTLEHPPHVEDKSCCAKNAKVEAPPKENSCCAGNNPSKAVQPTAAAKYFCPMCPGVESEAPGDCPKCGMALERNPAWVGT